MNTKQRVAFVQAQSVCALAEIEGMKAENQQRIHRNESLAYDDEAFFSVPAKYGLDHKTVFIYKKKKKMSYETWRDKQNDLTWRMAPPEVIAKKAYEQGFEDGVKWSDKNRIRQLDLRARKI